MAKRWRAVQVMPSVQAHGAVGKTVAKLLNKHGIGPNEVKILFTREKNDFRDSDYAQLLLYVDEKTRIAI